MRALHFRSGQTCKRAALGGEAASFFAFFFCKKDIAEDPARRGTPI